jgi:hypothetical protein
MYGRRVPTNISREPKALGLTIDTSFQGRSAGAQLQVVTQAIFPHTRAGEHDLLAKNRRKRRSACVAELLGRRALNTTSPCQTRSTRASRHIAINANSSQLPSVYACGEWLERFIDERSPPLTEVALAASAFAELGTATGA